VNLFAFEKQNGKPNNRGLPFLYFAGCGENAPRFCTDRGKTPPAGRTTPFFGV
jgi:hypothetical protein